MPTNSSAMAIASLKAGGGFPGFTLPGANNAGRLSGGVRSDDVAQAQQALTADGPEVSTPTAPGTNAAPPASQFNTGDPTVETPSSSNGPRAGNPLTVDPSLGTQANPAPSVFSSPHGGYIPAGVPNFNGTASVYPTTWTNDAGLGWVPRAQLPGGFNPSGAFNPLAGGFMPSGASWGRGWRSAITMID